MKADLFHCFANGSLAASGNQWALADAPWTEHKDFPGVFLKNLAGPELTQGLLTCHLVRIEALKRSAGMRTVNVWNCMRLWRAAASAGRRKERSLTRRALWRFCPPMSRTKCAPGNRACACSRNSSRFQPEARQPELFRRQVVLPPEGFVHMALIRKTGGSGGFGQGRIRPQQGARQTQTAQHLEGVGRQAGFTAEAAEEMPGAVAGQGGQPCKRPGRRGVGEQQAAYALDGRCRRKIFRQRSRIQKTRAKGLLPAIRAESGADGASRAQPPNRCRGGS